MNNHLFEPKEILRMNNSARSVRIPITWLDLIGEHRLTQCWIVFFNNRYDHNTTCKGNFINQLMVIGEIETVEDFFRAYCLIKKPSELPINVELRIFRSGVIPMWEYNPEGGALIFKISMKTNINESWEQLILACIGEHFNTLNVVGIVLSTKADEFYIQVWVKKAKEEKKYIVKILGDIFKIDFSKGKIYFKTHHASMIDRFSTNNIQEYRLRKKIMFDIANYQIMGGCLNQREENKEPSQINEQAEIRGPQDRTSLSVVPEAFTEEETEELPAERRDS